MNLVKARKDFITERGFKNLSEFARAVHDDPTNVHKVVKGQQRPTIEKLLKYAAVLDADVIQLVYLFYFKETSDYVKARNALADERRKGNGRRENI